MRCIWDVMLYVINWYVYDMICGRHAWVMLFDFYNIWYRMICAWRELVRAKIWYSLCAMIDMQNNELAWNTTPTHVWKIW